MAKIDHDVKAHPLVAGFPIEYALRHLANDPKNSDDIRNLASAAVTGKDRITGQVKPEGMPEALFLLHDALQEHQNEDGSYGHPMAKAYNWMSAARKVWLDQKTYAALTEESENSRRIARSPHFPQVHRNAYENGWSGTPEAHAIRASMGYYPRQQGTDEWYLLNRVKNRVQELDPDAEEDDIDESIKRHAHRAKMAFRHLHYTDHHEAEHDRAIQPGPIQRQKPPFGDETDQNWSERKATRYSKRKGLPVKRYSLAVRGDFIDSLRRIKSSNHEALHKTAEEVAKKLGFSETKIFAALHDSPRGSVPGLAQAIYGQAAPEHVHAAAAWIGLTGNLPGVAVFHVRDRGPDTLYRMRQDGSGLDIRQKLDRYGLTNRILVPHKKGFDIVIPDKGSTLSKNVWGYSQKHGLTLEQSNGFFSTIGSQDQARARDMFRTAVVKSEKMARKPKKYAAHNSVLKVDGEENPITKHYKNVYGYAFNLTKDHNKAEELTQHAMTVGLQKLPTLHDPSVEPKVRAYLFQIARTKHLKDLRGKRRHREVELDPAYDSPAPESDTGHPISSEQLHVALGKINPIFADTLRLHYLEGKTQQEIANHHGVPLMTVGTRLFKGRQLLKGLLSHKLSRRLFRHVGA